MKVNGMRILDLDVTSYQNIRLLHLCLFDRYLRARRESPRISRTATIGDDLARHVRKTRLPRAPQAGGRRDGVRQSRYHRTAADGRIRGGERDQIRARPAGGRPDGDGG